jgi:hypothetical protein
MPGERIGFDVGRVQPLFGDAIPEKNDPISVVNEKICGPSAGRQRTKSYKSKAEFISEGFHLAESYVLTARNRKPLWGAYEFQW